MKPKLGIRVSPCTGEKHLRNGGPVRTPDPNRRWLPFVHSHAKVIVVWDFFVVMTASSRTLYMFVMMEFGARKILHHNVTGHPTADWTMQQFRKAAPETDSETVGEPLQPRQAAHESWSGDTSAASAAPAGE